MSRRRSAMRLDEKAAGPDEDVALVTLGITGDEGPKRLTCGLGESRPSCTTPQLTEESAELIAPRPELVDLDRRTVGQAERQAQRRRRGRVDRVDVTPVDDPIPEGEHVRGRDEVNAISVGPPWERCPISAHVRPVPRCRTRRRTSLRP